jgi:hypothetical protein
MHVYFIYSLPMNMFINWQDPRFWDEDFPFHKYDLYAYYNAFPRTQVTHKNSRILHWSRKYGICIHDWSVSSKTIHFFFKDRFLIFYCGFIIRTLGFKSRRQTNEIGLGHRYCDQESQFCILGFVDYFKSGNWSYLGRACLMVVNNSQEFLFFFATRFFHKIHLVVYLNFQIGLTFFGKLKPYFVNKLQDFNSCYCKYYQEMA